MSIAFIPITEDNPLYGEKIIKDKWTSFLNDFHSSITSEFDFSINQNEFNMIVENCLNDIYFSSSSQKDEVEKTEVEKRSKKEDKKKLEKEDKKESKKEEKEVLRCVQILKNNEQCKGKQVKGGEYCTRHSKKEEEE
jgi:hypothetical protein